MVVMGGGGRGNKGMFALSVQFKTKTFHLATQKRLFYVALDTSQKVKTCIPCVIETV